jgi:hypothetical protein
MQTDQRLALKMKPRPKCKFLHQTVQELAFNIPKAPFIRLNLSALVAGAPNANTLTIFALLCQASVQNLRIIKPHPAWPTVLGLAKRSWFWALASLETKRLIRRDAGRIELLGALAESIPGQRMC